MSRRKRFELKTNHNSTFALNITSMTDMFTIMLVFLLQTYSTAEVQITPEQGQNLPQSTSEVNPVLALQISVTKDAIKLDDQVIMKMENSDFAKTDISPDDPNFVQPLFKALEKIAQTEKAKDEAFQTALQTGTVQMEKDSHGNRIPAGKPNQGILDGKILLKADQSLPYQTIRKIMYTASMAGFPKLKMATVVGN
jgi:biopolymer transport protein ExbD